MEDGPGYLRDFLLILFWPQKTNPKRPSALLLFGSLVGDGVAV